jgi:hypothetical protein
MEHDPEYGEAVLRTRVHENTPEDIALYNTRVLKDAYNPGGVDLEDDRYRDLLVITETNKARIALNALQARARTTGAFAPKLYSCVARHVIGTMEASRGLHDICAGVFDLESLLELDLYIGAPVILKVSARLSLGSPT